MTYDLQIGWKQVRWLKPRKVKLDENEHHPIDLLKSSIKAMFSGLEIVSVEVDRSNHHDPKPITITFANEHELTAAKLLI